MIVITENGLWREVEKENTCVCELEGNETKKNILKKWRNCKDEDDDKEEKYVCKSNSKEMKMMEENGASNWWKWKRRRRVFES